MIEVLVIAGFGLAGVALFGVFILAERISRLEKDLTRLWYPPAPSTWDGPAV